jgi:hypothetical protein
MLAFHYPFTSIATSSLLHRHCRRKTYLLSGGIPNIEFDGSTIGVEKERVHFDSQSRDVFLLELSRQVALDKGSLTDTTVSDEDQFEFGNFLLCLHCVDGRGEFLCSEVCTG